jgi:putative phosphonoacetaldehyde dehydrogenase
MDPRHETLRVAGGPADCEARIEVRNPYTGRVVGSVPKANREAVDRAFGVALAWRARLTRHERSRILTEAARAVLARADEVSALITAESGLCLKDSRYEVGRVADVLTFGAHLALVDDGQVYSCDLTPHGKKRRVYTMREPLLGVISAITPFNHPMNQVAHKVVPAVASNNRMVLKPSEKVPLSALLFADLLYEAGLPREMLQVVTGDPAELGEVMVTHPAADLITFTGGAEIGRAIAARAGYRRLVLELGGNDPLIVLDDADLDLASTLAVQGSYKNSGQRCTAVKRILVQESVADRFVETLVDKSRAWRCGNPFDEASDMGTVISEQAARLFERRVGAAIEAGARLLLGNAREGALFPPTVLDRVRPDMELVREETFGPVSPVIRFRDADEAIAIANSTRFGLSSAICTNRLDLIPRFVSELHVGTVNVNEVPGYRLEHTPFGGIKDSGLGYKEGVAEAIRSFTHQKTYSMPWA